tara:strand:- start:167 stop:2356 length:2190 start_codon:yes stop_codon:yes gene_type:complete
MKYYNIILISLLLLLSTSCSFRKSPKVQNKTDVIQLSNEENLEKILKDNNRVIIRDNWGVPHVYGHTDGDAAFSLAYANAEDDFFNIQGAVLKARGKYSSVYGPGHNKINVIFDYMVGLLKIWEIVDEKYYTELSNETILLCESYADGINSYIEQNKKNIKQYIYPVNGKDIIAATMHKTPTFYQLPLFFSDLYTKKPEDIPSHYTIGDTIEILKNLDIKGSNVYAVSPELSGENETFLAINSHQPFDGELAWYEAHIHSNEGWNMIGGLFPGSPVVLVGHNEHLGWGHTVNKPDIVDIYKLDINPNNNNQYLFDGKWLDFETFEIDIDIKLLGKALIKHTEQAFWSIHGPVIRGELATYAIKYSKSDDIRIIEQWYRMNKASNFDEWISAMEMMSIPMFNAGYADKTGNIYYIYNASLPIRNENYDWQKVLPGNTSKTLWNEYLDFSNLPMIKNPNSGYIQNCNSSPFLTSKTNNPDINNYSTTFGIETYMTNRALRANETFGNDSSITYEEFKKYKFDKEYSKESTMYSYVQKAIVLLKKSDLFSNININTLNQSIKTLQNWDFNTNASNPNAALPILSFSSILDTDPVKITNEILIKNIAQAINHLEKYYNKIDVKWGEINRLIRGETNLELSGGPDVARAIYSIPQDNQGQLKSIAGDCYILLARWNENGKVFSESIHQYGSATQDPNSKHYSDQTKLFSDEKFKEISIYTDDVIKNASSILILK